jgi:hypothetical protein
MIGKHFIRLTGSVKKMPNITSSITFKLEVKDYCLDQNVILGSLFTSAIPYELGSGAKDYTFPPWTDTHGGVCGSFLYTLLSNELSSQGSLTFGPSNRALRIKASNPNLAGRTINLQI